MLHYFEFGHYRPDSIKYLDLRNPQAYLVDHKLEMNARKGLFVSNTEIVMIVIM